MNNKLKLFLTILSFSFHNVDLSIAGAGSGNDVEHQISLQNVTVSAVKHYPQILSYYQKLNIAESNYLSTLGFFDIKLKQEYIDKSRGFYDGKVFNSSLEKELGFMGSKIYTGYRKSFKGFPVYEGDSITNNGGEYRLGGKVSLLKDGIIDNERLQIFLSNLGIEESKIQLKLIKKEIERDSTKAYYKSVASAKILQIYEELYQLSIKRQSQLEERLKKGDVAQIIVAENKKNVLHRKNSLIKAEQNFINDAIYLSLFYRDEAGKPVIINRNQIIDNNFLIHSIKNHQIIQDLEIATVHRPELKILNIKKEQNLKELQYAKNLIKPQLDVDIAISKDLGGGSMQRKQANNNLAVNFSLPLQQREARGKISALQAKLKSLSFEKQLIIEKIKNELEQINVQISAIFQIYQNLQEEVKLAELLEKSEKEKFKQGASNFFLVNIREQDTAISRVAIIEMVEKYQYILADYKMALFMDDEDKAS